MVSVCEQVISRAVAAREKKRIDKHHRHSTSTLNTVRFLSTVVVGKCLVGRQWSEMRWILNNGTM